VSYSSFGEVVRSLGLGNVDDLIVSSCSTRGALAAAIMLLTLPDMEPIMTIDPPSGMSLAASRAQNQVPMTLMSSSFRIFSVG
jgi:hypothetical protein